MIRSIDWEDVKEFVKVAGGVFALAWTVIFLSFAIYHDGKDDGIEQAQEECRQQMEAKP